MEGIRYITPDDLKDVYVLTPAMEDFMRPFFDAMERAAAGVEQAGDSQRVLAVASGLLFRMAEFAHTVQVLQAENDALRARMN